MGPTSAERQRLLVEWNETARDYPRAKCIHELFVEQATRTPEAVAIMHAGAHVSYRELDRRSNQLARKLAQRGISPGARVGIWLDRSAELIVGLLGVLKAGATYVPLEVSWPLDRVGWVLATLAVPCIVTDRKQLRALHDLRWKLPALGSVMCLDIDDERLPSEPIDVRAVRSLWDHVAGSETRVAQGGFVSSYTGELFADHEVDQYRAHVLSLVRPYLGPDRRVLEIGCGNGELMFAIAPHVASYVGLDPSEAMQQLNRERASREGHARVELLSGFAHELDHFDVASFDLVIVASAIQFFPGPVYLERTLEKVLAVLRPGGTIVMADLLDARQKEAFVESIAAFRRQHPSRSTKAKTSVENELYVDEHFLHELGERLAISVIAVHKRHGFDNELQFRIDAVFTTSSTATPTGPSPESVITRWHLERTSDESVSNRSSSEDLAYIIHTSGSTGTPKGVMVRHRPVINVIDWVNRTFGVGAADRLLFVTSICFDLSVYDIFGMLAAGGSIRIASSEEARDPERLFDILTTEPITFWDSAPAALQQLVPQLADHSTGGALRLVFLSGDWIPVTLPDVVRRAFPSARVISLGGATEATVWSNYFPIETVDPSWISIPYGKPIQNARYHVLDDQLEPCAIGVVGDLHIGGECLADGYANDDALTAAKFIPDPFSARNGDRLYKTGDLARYWPDGNLEFLGRSDHQVKIRGYRVELGEIETVLLRHPGVREAVIAARQEGSDKRLVAYIVPEAPTPSLAQLRRHLREKLPDYMVPSTFVMLDAMPITANGKVNRNALPAPDAPTLVAPVEVGDVRDPEAVARSIAAIFAETLDLPAVEIEDDFFELGGHSILAATAVARIEATFGVELPLRLIYEAVTARALASIVVSVLGMTNDA